MVQQRLVNVLSFSCFLICFGSVKGKDEKVSLSSLKSLKSFQKTGLKKELTPCEESHEDKNTKPLFLEKEFEKSTSLYYQAKTSWELENLAWLIQEGTVDKDEYGEKVPHEKRVHVVARLCRKLKTPWALATLAWLIEKKMLHEDECGVPINECERMKCAVRLYRKAKTPKALGKLASFIRQRKINEDENDNRIPPGKEAEVAHKLECMARGDGESV